MATEEVNKPPSLPPYPEMIFAALDGLNENEGSNKSSISNHIESKYGDLPAGHSNLLSQHLNEMKESGELVFVKNNYMKMKPDPTAPPKRGRGRPPKPKQPSPPGGGPAIVSTRPRGRPRKDPNAPPALKKARPADTSGGPTVSKTGRPRGRPRKVKPEMAQTGVQAN
uniref:HMG-Y-related protein A n=1 Tax=Davidia involucrata TaxID=16924 RepID=A0A5B7B911_DAVIN